MPYLSQQILSAYLKFKEILVKYVLNSRIYHSKPYLSQQIHSVCLKFKETLEYMATCHTYFNKEFQQKSIYSKTSVEPPQKSLNFAFRFQNEFRIHQNVNKKNKQMTVKLGI